MFAVSICKTPKSNLIFFRYEIVKKKKRYECKAILVEVKVKLCTDK